MFLTAVLILKLLSLGYCLELYQNGLMYGDKQMDKDENVAYLNLLQPMLLFSVPLSRIKISYGEIRIWNERLVKLNIYNNIYTANEKDGDVFFRESKQISDLSQATEDVRKFNGDNSFTANHSIIITYINVPTKYGYISRYSTYQAVLASNGTATYAILNYVRIDDYGAKVGYREEFCGEETFVSPDDSRSLLTTTNIDTKGRHVFLLTKKCNILELYPYGVEEGHSQVAKSDSVKEFILKKPLMFLSNPTRSLFITTGAVISADEPVKLNKFNVNYTNKSAIPIPIPYKAIFCFSSSRVDGSDYGEIFYHETFDRNISDQFTKDIQSQINTNFRATHVVIVTFNNFRLYSDPINVYTAQVVIASDANSSFAISICKSTSKKDVHFGFSEFYCNSGKLPIYLNSFWKGSINYFIGKKVVSLTDESCRNTSLVFYPYGEPYGDKRYSPYHTRAPIKYRKIELQKSMYISPWMVEAVYIHIGGGIYIDTLPALYTTNCGKNEFCLMKKHSLKLYPSNYISSNFGSIYYRVLTDNMLLQRASHEISKFTGSEFVAIQAIVVSYIDVSMECSSCYGTYQVVLAANETDTFLILYYKKFQSSCIYCNPGLAYVDPSCDEIQLGSLQYGQLDSSSNTGIKGKYIYHLKMKCSTAEFFPYGVGSGDKRKNRTGPLYFHLDTPFRLFNTDAQDIYISDNGIVSVNEPLDDFHLNFPNEHTLIVPYGLNMTAIENGDIFYRETHDPNILSRASKQIRKYGVEGFTGKIGILVTYLNMSYVEILSRKHDFQVFLVTDLKETYAILLYKRLDMYDAFIGFSEGFCNGKFLNDSINSKTMKSSSNIGEPGVHVVPLHSSNCVKNKTDLYPFGAEVGDHFVKYFVYDDILTLKLRKPFLLFLSPVNEIYISVDGAVSSTPSGFSQWLLFEETVLYLFFENSRFEFDSVIYYRETFNQHLLTKAMVDIKKHNSSIQFNATHAIVITFINKRYYSASFDGQSSFQCILVSDNVLTFAILNYPIIDKFGATNGFYDRFCGKQIFRSSTQSSQPLSLTSNIGIPGRHVYFLSKDCRFSELFSYGIAAEDNLMKRGDNSYEVMNFSKAMIVTGKPKTEIYININGFVTEDYGIARDTIDIPSQHIIVAAYNIDLDTSSNGWIFYRETTESKILDKITSYISLYSSKLFVTKRAVIISYIDVPARANAFSKHTMQLILATDEEYTFGVWIYKQLDTINGVAGYSIAECKARKIRPTSDGRLLSEDSNVGVKGLYIRGLTSSRCLEYTNFYAWGLSAGDSRYNGDEIKLTKPMMLFSQEEDIVFVSYYGNIVVNSKSQQSDFNIPHKITILSAYTSSHCFECHDHSAIYYREEFDPNFLLEVSTAVRIYDNATFEGTHAIVVSWVNIGAKLNTFQAVLITNGKKTYAVLNYVYLAQSDAIVGISERACPFWAKYFISPDKSKELAKTSNIGVKGRHVHLLTGGCEQAELYPFGSDSGDMLMKSGDDYVEHFVIKKPMPLFSNLAKDLFISVNGFISINKPIYHPTIDLPHARNVLLCYSMDLDTTRNGTIFYREDSSASILEKANKDINKLVPFNATNAVIVTYVNVAAKNLPNKTNTFQAVLVTDGSFTFTILTYLKLDSSGAIIGYSNGLCYHKSFKNPFTSEKLVSYTNINVMGRSVFKLSVQFCSGNRAVAYPFGEKNGDLHLDNSLDRFHLAKSILFFSSKTWKLYIKAEGVVSIHGYYGTIYDTSIPHTILAIYSKDLSIKYYGKVYYRDILNSSFLSELSEDVTMYTDRDFNASYAIVITYSDVRTHRSRDLKHSFQVALVTDDHSTYAILKYFRLDSSDAFVGFSESFCNYNKLIEPHLSQTLTESSNVGVLGQYVYKLTSNCRKGELYAYGKEAGDRLMEPCAGCYEHLVLNKSFLLFSTPAKDIYISVNGFVSINEPLPIHVKRLTAEYSIIAPYMIEMDTTNHGKIYYRETFESSILKMASKDVEKRFTKHYDAIQAVIITYENVPSKEFHLFTQMFQLVLVTDGVKTFGIINYINIESLSGLTGFSEKFCDIFPFSNINNNKLTRNSNVDYKNLYVYQLTRDTCNGLGTDLYPFGSSSGHTEISGYDNKAIKFTLKQDMLLFSRNTRYLAVNTNGVIAINTIYSARTIKLPVSSTILAPYGLDFDTRHGGAIYVGETDDKEILERAAKDIELIGVESFNTKYVVIFSYINVPKYKDSLKRFTFQAVLATDGNKTYVILNYKQLNSSGATVGYSEPFCGWKLFSQPETSSSMLTSTNTGIPGKHVFLLTSERCLRSEMYPYGVDAGDEEMIKGDNDAVLLQLQSPMLLFSKNESRIYINTNGIISINTSVTFSINLPYHHTVVSPYHLDYDTTQGGNIYYRETNHKDILESATLDIEKYEAIGFVPTRAIIVSYIDVPLKENNKERNTFQVVLVSNGTLTYGIFNYDRLDSTSALTGFSEPLCFWMTFRSLYFDSDSLSYYLNQTSNIAVEGRFVFILTEENCEQSDRFESDLPEMITVTRLGYDFFEMKWFHDGTAVDSNLQKFPFHYVAYVTSQKDWNSGKYRFFSRYARIDGLDQNKTYKVELFTERRGLYIFSGHFVTLENIKTVGYESIYETNVAQAGTEALLTWKTPVDLIQDIVPSQLRVYYEYQQSWIRSNVSFTTQICENKFSFTGDIGSMHIIKISPLVDDVEGPFLTVNYTFIDDSTDDSNTNITIILPISLVAFVLVAMLIVGFSCYQGRRNKKYNNLLLSGATIKLDPDGSILEQCSDLPYDTNFEFKRKNISLVRIVGEGAFGQVWMATAINIDQFQPRVTKKFNFMNLLLKRKRDKKIIVAIKSLKGNATIEEYKDLVNELKLLIHIGEHRNVVNLLGACTQSSDLLVILEYCALGSLLNYLKLIRDDFQPMWTKEEGKNLHELTWLCVQVADGMAFLENKKCVHRDLAARNILLTNDMVVKVSDFGLSRHTHKKEYYKKTSDGLFPFKWMSPEAILYQTYTTKSDVWSFGVMLWEVYSLGSTPYPGIKNASIVSHLKSGQRMAKPQFCPVTVYEMMKQCWSILSDMRPAFADIRNSLAQVVLNNEKVFHSGQVISRTYGIGHSEDQDHIKMLNSQVMENDYGLTRVENGEDDYLTLKNVEDGCSPAMMTKKEKMVRFSDEITYVYMKDEDEVTMKDEDDQASSENTLVAFTDANGTRNGDTTCLPNR